MNEFDEGWSPHGWEQGTCLRVIIQRVGGSIYIEELHSTADEEHRGFWRGQLDDDTMLRLMKWLAWWGGNHEVRVVGQVAVPRLDLVITPEVLAAAHRAGNQAMEPYRQKMAALTRTATYSCVQASDGSISGGGFDDETERLLADLRVKAEEAYSLAARHVLDNA